MSSGETAAVFSAAAPALLQAVEGAGDLSVSTQERLVAANRFAETLAEIWSRLEAAGDHLVALLGLIDMAVTSLPEQAEAGEEGAVVPVLELIALLEAHLEAPDDAEVITALVELATSDVFEIPLDEDSVALWLARIEETSPAVESGLETLGDQPLDEAVAVTLDETPEPEPTPTYSLTDRRLDGPAPNEAVLSADAAELYALMAMAIQDALEDLLGHIEVIADAGDAETRGEAARACQMIFSRLASAAADAGFLALATFCASLGYQVSAMSRRPWPVALIEVLAGVPQRLLDYLDSPLEDSARLELVETLQHSCWLEPFSPVNAEELVLELYKDHLSLLADDEHQRPKAIEEADLALQPADDIDAPVLASFKREGPDLAHKLSILLERIIAGEGGEDALRQAQRLAHTIKGSANVCGVRAIAVLSHHLEDLMEFLTEQALAPSPGLGETLAAGADELAVMFDVLNGVEMQAPESHRAVMQAVLDWANRIDEEGLGALAEDGESVCAARGGDAAAQPEASAETEDEERVVQVPARVIDDLLRHIGELTMALSQSEEQLRQAQGALREVGAIEQHNLLRLSELETLVDLRGLGNQGIGGAGTQADATFDPIELEQYNAMYTATRRLDEGVSDVRELARTLDGALRNLDELSQQQVKLSQQMRQLAMEARLVPVGTVAPRLQRVLRQTCRATGKEAELVIQGADVKIDGEVMASLVPALMHVIRNAIDHGIEPGDRREAEGKPRQGRLEIGFGQRGDQIEIVVQDDGRGLDLEQVKAKAIEHGLIAADAELTSQEAARLTLQPGFSSRGQVTQVSGRGVGMDVVASTVRALSGTLAIDSVPSQGYRLTARLPGSLITSYCLLVQCEDQLFALPASEIRFALLSEEGSLTRAPDGWRFRYEEETFPLVHLNRLIGRPAPEPDAGRQVVLLVETETGAQAVMVEALHEGRELVLMKLGPRVPKVPGLMSASILGDGRVVPIIELRSLLRVAAGMELAEAVVAKPSEGVALPSVLIVDDSLSMRKILSRLAEDGGYRPLAARDGMEAIGVLERESVDALLVDMEMPQMNGLELTAHLRAQPDTRALPIAMITSRSTEKHRREAQRSGVDAYFVKPYRDDDVLDFLQQAIERPTLERIASSSPLRSTGAELTPT